MVNTRAQVSVPAMEVVAQSEVPPAGNQANDQPEPDVRHLAADVGDMKQALRAICENSGTAWPGTAPPASQASTSRIERRREAARRRRANRLDRAAVPEAPSENDQNEAESHPTDDDREDSPEGRNPQNSRDNGRPAAACSKGERATQVESRHRRARTHLQGNTELRDVINARRGSTDPSMEEKVKVL
ncbi:hypothetical protein Nepgr_033103 [Nepenthes gracilis]|uniref:Uncharacterized protein n=1 Tax=Nepenthes gracilis TaxID=150966 RepID=A0AAD3Y852_NEPGR|nr:hypothetical protein Nepgr_033103 [Nepenthes gracilis]